MTPSFFNHNAALCVSRNEPNTVYFVKQKGWFTTKYFDYCIESGLNHENIHSVLIKMGMKKESSKFDKVYHKWKKTQEPFDFFDRLM